MLKLFLLILLFYLIINALLPSIKKIINKHHNETTINRDNDNDLTKDINDEDIIDADYKELDEDK